MKNDKLYLTYALNKNRDLVHIDSVPNGNKCECFCPHCNSELCAKNGGSGEKMVHHFAHINGADCVGAVESALHKMAKDVMNETLSLQLPDRLDGSRGELLKFDNIEIECYDKETNLRPDCIGHYGDKVIWIEFKRTHAVDAKKKGKIISAKIDCVELDLNVCKQDPDEVRNFIINETQNRIWIRDTEQKTRIAGNSTSYNEYDYHGYRHIERVFAKDENGKLVSLLYDDVDMNNHNYYCLACGEELTIDINKLGTYIFVHVDENVHCDDDLYLHEAAKEILHHKFIASNDFKILVHQNQNCAEKECCAFFQSELCTTGKEFTYDLKQYGYTECLKDYKFQDFKFKCDLVIKTAESNKKPILISINAGACHVDINTDKYRVIYIEVSNSNELLSLLNEPIGHFPSTFINFKRDNESTISRSEIERKIFKFSLFSSGKYYIDKVSCDKLNEHKRTAVLEYIFIEGVDDKYDAELYSLLRCYEEKRKVCFCEICCFITRIQFYGKSETICKRYKTKGTPHYPLEVMPVNCPHFIIDKKVENVAKSNYNDVKVVEKTYQSGNSEQIDYEKIE